MTERAVYTVREFLELVPIGRSTFWDQVKAGKIPVVRFGRRTFVPAHVLAHVYEPDGGGVFRIMPDTKPPKPKQNQQ